MQPYRALEYDEMNQHADQPNEITHQMIKKMKKLISSHHAALAFDQGYLNKVKTVDGYDFVAEVKYEKQILIKLESGNEKRGGARRRRIQSQFPYKNRKQKANDNTGF